MGMMGVAVGYSPDSMKPPLLHAMPPVARDRIITRFPKWYTPEACLEFKDHFHERVANICQCRNATSATGSKVSKAVVVGDLCVGKTSLINRFCKDVFDRDYKATIGVDFEIERFEIAGLPYNLQIWDTAGQEKFKCIASAYYRGAQVIITVFDLADIRTLGHAKRWLEDAMMENDTDAASISLFLVGMKKDLLSDAKLHRMETDAVRIANEMGAEYWSVSAKTGENVKDFFLRAATLAFEKCILAAMDENSGRNAEIGSLLRIERTALDTLDANGQANPNCC